MERCAYFHQNMHGAPHERSQNTLSKVFANIYPALNFAMVLFLYVFCISFDKRERGPIYRMYQQSKASSERTQQRCLQSNSRTYMETNIF